MRGVDTIGGGGAGATIGGGGAGAVIGGAETDTGGTGTADIGGGALGSDAARRCAYARATR